ncbi:MAG: chromosome segregation protein SMC [Betaproteobacteria bacterium HGW-Betaproteobacteria-16]|nr:MAG: chromosome segregation protein SMC [Betaproteobacteria bacterium HGW-Betaproteobacteria-16]
MILVKSISIHEFRGVRDLTLTPDGKNFAVCGPNGTGKSGIVDALEFVLTGNISRLSGEGTGGLSVKEHGPHVDSRNRPEDAYVSVTLAIPSLDKEATIRRSVKDSRNPKISPDEPAIRRVIERVGLHPEFVLSRRELIRYILVEPGKRSKEVLALLRLDQVETLRIQFQRIANATEREVAGQKSVQERAGAALQSALNVPKLTKDALLAAVNERRALLGLAPLTVLEPTTSIKDGISTVAKANQPTKVIKGDASAHLTKLQEKLAELASGDLQAQCAAAQASISKLLQDEKFLDSATSEEFLQRALVAYDDQLCPVCDTPWEPEEFRARIAQKLARHSEAIKQRRALEKVLKPILDRVNNVMALCTVVAGHGAAIEPAVDCAPILTYLAHLQAVSEALTALLPLSKSSEALGSFASSDEAMKPTLEKLAGAIAALPEPNVQEAARDYLTICQERLETFRQASAALKAASSKAQLARDVFDIYASETTKALDAIYALVQETFSRLYRLVNQDDEEHFQARLKPSIGKLGFDVDFYGRGYFPPGAYHSEGHQDGMGLCLYLALMQHLAGDAFTFAVLDDVLMSVDSGHRREVSKMLLQEFPKTQFFLTTHDEIWLRHMKVVGLIKPKGAAHFRTWNVDQGPTEWDDKDVWGEIDSFLAKNDVRASAALLRNYLEHFSKEACHVLRAQVEFRGDAQFTLGDLLPRAISQVKKLLKEAKAVAQSWGQTDNFEKAQELETKFAAAAAASNAEQWQVNAAVHYNEWANLHRNDFEPVVKSFKVLVDAFTCQTCHAILFVTPEHRSPESMRCKCGSINVNLLKKT